MSEPEAGTFRDSQLPLGDRVADLLGRLTIQEMIALLHQHQPAIARLGIGPFRTGTEALHGLAWLGPATVFPQAVGLASTWNPELVRQVGAAVGDETRAFHHKDPSGAGLNVWAPVVNQLRDPRWGRNEEGYAEDPLLTGVMGTAYSEGLRGDHPVYLKTAPTLKHFLGYNNETLRDTSSSNLPPRVMHEYELPPFRAPIAAGAAVAVMASYNLVNGRPAHLSPLINSTLRGWAAHELLVVSDAQAPSNVVDPQHYYSDHASSHAALIKAGVDSFTDNGDRSSITIDRVTEALERGLLTEADIATALRHTFAIRFRLGEFDAGEGNPYASITEDVVNCPKHQTLARQAARESIVLLRNEDRFLPLTPAALRKVAVLGPLGDTQYQDWYSGTLPYAVTVRAGLTAHLGEDTSVSYVEGVDRVALRIAEGGPVGPQFDGMYLAASDSPTGSAVRAESDGAGTWFDVTDWGQGVLALRSVANGRHLTVDDSDTLVNDQATPNGWVVKETFRLVAASDNGVAIRHIASDTFVNLAADGTAKATAATLAKATRFTVELISSGLDQACAVAQDADVAIVVVGNHPMINGRETEDRADLALPPAQDELLRAVYEVNPRTVLVVQSSYPYGIGWAEEHVPAILWSSHGGQEFGNALAEVLCGEVAPAGRVTQTWYSAAADLPDLLDYDIIAADATYLYYRGTPLYPFGHGLTYTTFDYRDVRVSADEVDPDGEVTVTVDVVNTGERASDDVVQLYTRRGRSRVKQPLRQLRGFQRISVAAGQSVTVEFRIKAADLSYWDVTQDRFVVEAARHHIMVGRSATDIQGATAVVVRGEAIPARNPLAGPIPAVNHDEYAGITLLDASLTDGDAVGAVQAGAWVAFERVDFDAGVATATARISRDQEGSAMVTLRLDDPLDGEVIGTLHGICPGGRRNWIEAATRIGGVGHDASGVRDLYLVFGAAGVNVADLTFAPAKAEPAERNG